MKRNLKCIEVLAMPGQYFVVTYFREGNYSSGYNNCSYRQDIYKAKRISAYSVSRAIRAMSQLAIRQAS